MTNEPGRGAKDVRRTQEGLLTPYAGHCVRFAVVTTEDVAAALIDRAIEIQGHRKRAGEQEQRHAA